MSKNIKETKMLMENWANHVGMDEATLSTRRSMLDRILGRNKEDENDPNDAMPADGKDDDAIEVGDEDIIDQEPTDKGEQLKLAHAINFLTQDLEYKDFKNFILDIAQQSVRSAYTGIEDTGNPELDQLRKQVSGATAKKVLTKLRSAIAAAFPEDPKKFVQMKENLDRVISEWDSPRKIVLEIKK